MISLIVMDKKGNDDYKGEEVGGVKTEGLSSDLVSHNVNKEEGEEEEEDDERARLLPPRIGGDLSRKVDQKTRRKVRWKDNVGKKLVEVLEYQPR